MCFLDKMQIIFYINLPPTENSFLQELIRIKEFLRGFLLTLSSF